MNVGIGSEAVQFHIWKEKNYLIPIFCTVSLQCITYNDKTTKGFSWNGDIFSDACKGKVLRILLSVMSLPSA
jgi:hypothetical protein